MTRPEYVWVTWTECDCDVPTKYCEEHHSRAGRVLLSKIHELVKDGAENG